MGYDVYGNDPDAQVGEYFRANIFHWPPILDAIAQTGVVDEETCYRMSFNEGDGVDATTARKLADALSDLMRGGAEPMPSVAGASAVEAASYFVALVDADPEFPFEPNLLGQFVEFCRHSGGFRVA